MLSSYTSGNFNPRAPCGARHHFMVNVDLLERISIHAPLAGRDYMRAGYTGQYTEFQSTRPLRGATRIMPKERRLLINFNPRAPCGARPYSHPRILHRLPQFQSTRPLRGATVLIISGTSWSCDFNPRAPCGARRYRRHNHLCKTGISIHAPLAGRDGAIHNYYTCYSRFQSTRPLRGATITQ